MDQSVKLAALASLLAVSALAAGCVPSLNYGSVPPEPKYTTKVTTTTATAATTKPFTTPKPRTGTISWEELNGPMDYATRARYTEAATADAILHTGEIGGFTRSDRSACTADGSAADRRPADRRDAGCRGTAPAAGTARAGTCTGSRTGARTCTGACCRRCCLGINARNPCGHGSQGFLMYWRASGSFCSRTSGHRQDVPPPPGRGR